MIRIQNLNGSDAFDYCVKGRPALPYAHNERWCCLRFDSSYAEGTSDFYFPSEVPALANFLMQKAVTEVLELQKAIYHIGITYTTNMRFWEFNEEFKSRLKATKAQAIEMECATLFAASYKRKFTLGALLLVSDLPLNADGIKTKKSSESVYDRYMADHVEKGIAALKTARLMQEKHIKGAYHRNIGMGPPQAKR